MKNSDSLINNHRNLTSFDLKAEIIFNSLLNCGTDDLNIVIKNNSLFYRNFRKDRMDISYDPINSDVVNIEVSRDGFYDILPESIVHNYLNKSSNIDAVEEFKNRKKEEKEARHFFNPIENEFFRFKHLIETFESDFFSKLNSNKIADIIRTILAVDDTIPDKLIVKLFYALLKQNQNSDQSVGTISNILEEILQEKVKFTFDYIKLDNGYDVNSAKSELLLGVNTTLESNERIYLKKYNFVIGPLKESENLKYFFKNQSMEMFITTFFNLFLPFQIQFSFDIQLNESDEKFILENHSYKSRLGISTIL